jgi:hypothetical protein
METELRHCPMFWKLCDHERRLTQASALRRRPRLAAARGLQTKKPQIIDLRHDEFNQIPDAFQQRAPSSGWPHHWVPIVDSCAFRKQPNARFEAVDNFRDVTIGVDSGRHMG